MKKNDEYSIQNLHLLMTDKQQIKEDKHGTYDR